MDFVVVGFGLGALGVLLGVVMLSWLAPHAERAAARASAPDAAAHDLAVATEHRGTGQAFLYGGSAMLLATCGGLAGGLDDRTGALLVTTTATVAAVGIVLGGYLQRVRNPAPPRRRPSPAVMDPVVVAGPPVTESAVPAETTAGADPGAAEAWKMFLDDHEETRIVPFPAPTAPTETATEDSASYLGSNGRPASGDTEPNRVSDLPDGTSTTSEGELHTEPSNGQPGGDAAVVEDEEEEAVIVGYVVPAARPANSPLPPTRRDEGEDPS